MSEKTLTYACGRVLNYAERQEIEKIVEKHHAAEGEETLGFRDLMLELIDSEAFRRR